jgi:predicted TPR repeat methyltransferase
LNNLAAIHIRLEQREQAIILLERALDVKPDDEPSQFMLYALTGKEKKPAASQGYARNLFNNYALYYDQHMRGALHYAIPHHIGRLLHKLLCDKITYAVDLGCGTGLSGIVLREWSTHLTGVDISEKMLAQANQKDIYDTLIEAEIVTFLQHDHLSYQLIVAADVLPYLGELDSLFAAIHHRLEKEGLFIFTHEMNETEPWTLQDSARFNHHCDYIKAQCDQHQLKIVAQEKVTARQQHQHPLNVMLYAVVPSIYYPP